jgi:CMP-N-acetylneuraminic acid synthetase
VKYIIPAKCGSVRVPNKNWRPFYRDLSLVDILIEKLLKCGIDPEAIYVSCESLDRLNQVRDRWRVNSILRSESLCDNSVSLVDWIRGITSQVPGTDDISWCQVCDPMFDEYPQCFDLWRKRSKEADSLVVRRVLQSYLLTQSGQPVGWSFGEHHTPSQKLPAWGVMPFTLSILTRECIRKVGYHVGRNPMWYTANSYGIDIDDMSQFEAAKEYYKAIRNNSSLANTEVKHD